MEFDISLDGEDRLRQAFRTRVPGLDLRFALPGGPRVVPVRDISATGLAVSDAPEGYSPGQVLDCDLLLARRVFLGSVKARVSRVLEAGIIGCVFEGLDRRQQIKLDKLVLEVQKRLIELRRARRAAEEQG